MSGRQDKVVEVGGDELTLRCYCITLVFRNVLIDPVGNLCDIFQLSNVLHFLRESLPQCVVGVRDLMSFVLDLLVVCRCGCAALELVLPGQCLLGLVRVAENGLSHIDEALFYC